MPGRQYGSRHSQDLSEMAAGSSEESEKVHVAEGSCPVHKEAVPCFQGGFVCRLALKGCSVGMRGDAQRQDFHHRHNPIVRASVLKESHFFFSPWIGSPVKALLFCCFRFPTTKSVTKLFGFVGSWLARVWLLALWLPGVMLPLVRMWFLEVFVLSFLLGLTDQQVRLA